jgi:hypothetical protein
MVEMQFDRTDAELTDYLFDALVDCGVVGAVASDKFFDNRAYRSACQQPMGNEHQPTSSGDATPKIVVTKIRDRTRSSSRTDHPASESDGLDHLGFCFPFADCSCFSAFCFLFLSFSFLPPLSPILDSSLPEIVGRAFPQSAIIAPPLCRVESDRDSPHSEAEADRGEATAENHLEADMGRVKLVAQSGRFGASLIRRHGLPPPRLEIVVGESWLPRKVTRDDRFVSADRKPHVICVVAGIAEVGFLHAGRLEAACL